MTYQTQRKKAMEILNELDVAIKELKPVEVQRLIEALTKGFGKLTVKYEVIYDYTPEWQIMEKLRGICSKWFTACSDDTGFPVAQRAFEHVKSVAYGSDGDDFELRNCDDLIYYRLTGDSSQSWDRSINNM